MSIIENRNFQFSLSINTVSYQPVLPSEFIKKPVSVSSCVFIFIVIKAIVIIPIFEKRQIMFSI